jgi:hypothetical protein
VGSTETMKRHRSERKGEHANDKERHFKNPVHGCVPTRPTPKKNALATADLVRDWRQTGTDKVSTRNSTKNYCSFACSAFAAMRIGMSGSAFLPERAKENPDRPPWPSGVLNRGIISGSEDRGRRDRPGAHRRWWRGLEKNRMRYRCRKSGGK